MTLSDADLERYSRQLVLPEWSGAAQARLKAASVIVVVAWSGPFAARYVVNDACCALGVPLVEAGVLGFDGLGMAIRPGESACCRCAFPVEPAEGSVPSCREAGVLGPVAGIVGSIQAL